MPDAPEKPRVLIVDDDAAIRRALKRLLLKQYAVECLPNAHEALARVRTGEPFDVLITDVTMAEVSGMQLYETIARERPADSGRFIFLTGADAAPEGDLTVLFKPVDGAALQSAIDAKVELGRERQAAAVGEAGHEKSGGLK